MFLSKVFPATAINLEYTVICNLRLNIEALKLYCTTGCALEPRVVMLYNVHHWFLKNMLNQSVYKKCTTQHCSLFSNLARINK